MAITRYTTRTLHGIYLSCLSVAGARGRAARRCSGQVGVRVQRARAVRADAGGGRRESGRRDWREGGRVPTARCGSAVDGPLALDGTPSHRRETQRLDGYSAVDIAVYTCILISVLVIVVVVMCRSCRSLHHYCYTFSSSWERVCAVGYSRKAYLLKAYVCSRVGLPTGELVADWREGLGCRLEC